MSKENSGDLGCRPNHLDVKGVSGNTFFTMPDFSGYGRITKYLSLFALILLLAACGGSSGSEPTTETDEPAAEAEADEEMAEEEMAEDEEMAEEEMDEEMADEEMAEEEMDEEMAEEEMDEEMEEMSDAFPVTIDHKYGSTEIPHHPERVVSVGFSEQDELLALGVVPVGVRYWYGPYENAFWPWAQDELGDAQTEIVASDVINFEAIAALEPDLIVGITSGMTEEEYDSLSAIAPTLAQSGDYVDYGVPWQEVTRVLGQATGTSEKAETIVTDLEARFAEIRANNPEFDGASLAVGFWFSGTPGVYASQDARPRLLSELGFVTPELYDEVAGDSFFLSFSEEELPQFLDVDLVVWLAGSDQGIEDIKNSELRGTLPIAQEGREIFFGELLGGAFSFSSPLSLNFLLDEMVPMIEAAMDGDPSTVVPGAEGAVGVTVAEGLDPAITSGPVSPLPRTVTDFEGNEVVIEDDSVVIPIDGPLTEIVFTLGMADNVAATDVSSTYPVDATQLPQVGYVRALSAEPVLAMAPTLILTTDDAGPPDAVTQLEESGVTVVQFKSPDTIEESIQLVRDVAAALGVESRGEALVAKMEADLAIAADLLAQVNSTPRVMFIYARGVDSVSAAGAGTSVDVMFELAGLENAVTEWEGYQPLTAEGAVSIAPDAFLLFNSGLESVGGAEGLLGVPGIAETPAGDSENIHSMDGLLLTGLGPRVGEAVIDLILMLHPDLAE
ncbi:MAG: ABC transporter substrate-binding protein [Chloroflexota bacterium]